MAKMNDRCGECENCKKVERTKRRVLACCGAPNHRGVIHHADDGVVDVWNKALKDWPCTGAPKTNETAI